MTCTNVNPTGKQEVPPETLLLNRKIQDGTEESGHQLGREQFSAGTMDIRVFIMEAYLNNQGIHMEVIEDLLKQVVGSGIAKTSTQVVISPVPLKRGSGT